MPGPAPTVLLLALLALAAAAPTPAAAAAAAASASAAASPSAFAAVARAVPVGGRLTVTNYRLEGDALASTLELARFQLFSPGAQARAAAGEWGVGGGKPSGGGGAGPRQALQLPSAPALPCQLAAPARPRAPFPP